MADEPSSDSSSKDSGGAPSPEALQPQDDATSETAAATSDAGKDKDKSKDGNELSKELVMRRRASYRPSHKATFIGLAAVAIILALNGAVIFVIFKQQASKEGKTAAQQDQVTVNQAALDKLGVNRSSVGNAGIELTVNPDAKFKGQLAVGGDLSVAGQFKLNSKLSASDASLAKLDAGDVSIAKLNLNGAATMNDLNLRKDLVVAGTSRFQGDVVLARLLTVNNSANIAGNLSVGGTLTVNRFQATSLTSDTTLTIGGHIITRGTNPAFVAGSGALGSNGTASNSGNDAAGTVFAGVGVGAGAGLIGTVNFRQAYPGTPRLVVTGAVVSGGGAVRNVYTSRTSTGFSIFVADALQPGSYAFDYIVMQ